MSFLTVSGISKEERKNFLVNDINFTQQKFQKVAVAGETGSGKSTLLKIVAGLVQPDRGEVSLEGKRVLGPDEKLMPGHPSIAYLSQQYELRNNYRVEEELAYTNKLPEGEAATVYEVCRIAHLLQRRTNQLSGGEKQRIATARLLISSPALLLLDEPFSNLDPAHKGTLKSVIRDIGERLNITCMLAAHDPPDTLSWADEILVLKGGSVVQRGAPEHIYRKPVDEYTAVLFGPCTLLTNEACDLFPQISGSKPAHKKVLVRPEWVTLNNTGEGCRGEVNEVSFFGSYYEIAVAVPGQTIIARTTTGAFVKGDPIWVTLSPDHLWFV